MTTSYILVYFNKKKQPRYENIIKWKLKRGFVLFVLFTLYTNLVCRLGNKIVTICEHMHIIRVCK